MDTWNGFWLRFLCAVVLLSVVCGYCFGVGVEEGLVIGSVEVAGNVSRDRRSILSRARVRVGDVFDEKSVSEDAERIAGLDGVSSSYYNTELVEGKVRLVFVVVEQQRIRSIVFFGNKKLKDGSLKTTVGFNVGEYLDTFLARRSVSDLVERYHKKGYSKVEVSLDEASLKLGNIKYSIKEGPRTRVKQVGFAGNSDILSKSLSREVKTRKRKFVVWPAYYSAEVVAEDVTNL